MKRHQSVDQIIAYWTKMQLLPINAHIVSSFKCLNYAVKLKIGKYESVTVAYIQQQNKTIKFKILHSKSLWKTTSVMTHSTMPKQFHTEAEYYTSMKISLLSQNFTHWFLIFKISNVTRHAHHDSGAFIVCQYNFKLLSMNNFQAKLTMTFLLTANYARGPEPIPSLSLKYTDFVQKIILQTVCLWF